jgi:putative redox protein
MSVVMARWNGDLRFVAVDGENHSIVMDSPSGDYVGMRPMEMVLAGLAGCTGMDVISILRKQRQDVSSMTVTVHGDQHDERPRGWAVITVDYEVVGTGVNPEFVARAIELSEQKYCAVRGSLAPDIAFTSSYRVLEASAPVE